MINQKAIPAGWSVDGDGSDFAIFVFEAQMVTGILGESDCPLERPRVDILSNCVFLWSETFSSPVSYGQNDVIHVSLLENVVNFVFFESGQSLAVDLQNLISEFHSAHRRRTVFGDQTHEDAFIHWFDLQADFALGVFA